MTLGFVDPYPAPVAGSTWFGAPGMLAQNSVARLDDVKDGLSSTIMIGESAGRPALYRNGKQVGNIPQHIVNGGGWMRPASDFSVDGSSYDGTTLPGPCPINCTNGQDGGGAAGDPRSAGKWCRLRKRQRNGVCKRLRDIAGLNEGDTSA